MSALTDQLALRRFNTMRVRRMQAIDRLQRAARSQCDEPTTGCTCFVCTVRRTIGSPIGVVLAQAGAGGPGEPDTAEVPASPPPGGVKH